VETLNDIWAWIGWAAGGALEFLLGNWRAVVLIAVGALIAFVFIQLYRHERAFREAIKARATGSFEDIGKGIVAVFNVPRRYFWLGLAGAVALVLVWEYWPVCPGDPGKVQDVLACSQINRNYGLLLAGVAALVALHLNWQRTISDRRRVENDATRLTTDTYVKAIEQLGHDKMEVRLGAIYALERIARDAEDFDLHWSIMETLSAYIRERPASKWG
jgi:hypothetical protein